jgi:hypothetical protein
MGDVDLGGKSVQDRDFKSQLPVQKIHDAVRGVFKGFKVQHAVSFQGF